MLYLLAISSNTLAVRQRLTCSVRPLYQSPPAAPLKITSSHGSNKIKLYCEECCPSVQWQQCEWAVVLPFWFQGHPGGSTDENPFSPFIIQTVFWALARCCTSMATLLLLAFQFPVVNVLGEESKEWEEMREDETSNLPIPLIYRSWIHCLLAVSLVCGLKQWFPRFIPN